jgi:hypothetical protein
MIPVDLPRSQLTSSVTGMTIHLANPTTQLAVIESGGERIERQKSQDETNYARKHD